jgi:hypothetical protein
MKVESLADFAKMVRENTVPSEPMEFDLPCDNHLKITPVLWTCDRDGIDSVGIKGFYVESEDCLPFTTTERPVDGDITIPIGARRYMRFFVSVEALGPLLIILKGLLVHVDQHTEATISDEDYLKIYKGITAI